jgi:hypothetical protein
MLLQLETNKHALNVKEYGISVTTMEDVFLKVASEQESANAAKTSLTADSKDNCASLSNGTSKTEPSGAGVIMCVLLDNMVSNPDPSGLSLQLHLQHRCLTLAIICFRCFANS